MTTALASTTAWNPASSGSPALRSTAARAAAAAVAIVVLLAVSFVFVQLHATAADAAPSATPALMVRPSWGHCSTPGIPC